MDIVRASVHVTTRQQHVMIITTILIIIIIIISKLVPVKSNSLTEHLTNGGCPCVKHLLVKQKCFVPTGCCRNADPQPEEPHSGWI